MDFVDKIKEFDLLPIVNRPETPLFRSFTGVSYVGGNFEKATGLPWEPEVEVCTNGDVMYTKSDLSKLKQAIARNYENNSEYFFELADLTYKRMEDLKTTAVKCGKLTEIKPCSSRELLTCFNEYIQAALRAWPFLIIMPVADPVITKHAMELLIKKTGDERKAGEYFCILCLPEKENKPNKEEKAFLKLCELAKRKDKQLENRVKAHVVEFGWFGSRNLWGTAWTEADVTKRIEDFLQSGADPAGQIKQIEETGVEVQRARREIETKLAIKQGDALWTLLQIGREYAFLRTYRTDCMHWAGFQIKPLLSAIAKKFDISYTELVMMSFKEIQNSLEENRLAVPQIELQLRKKEFGTVLIDGEFHVVSGEKLEKLKKIVESKFKTELSDSVRGNPAFQGKVVGTARIVMSQFDLPKVKQGDVLVTVMTFPNYVPAMEKACAFVTDEGGILCHAAIVSREMQKPCVIATKHATKTFKDGDRIEVDAVKGIVRKVI